MRFDDALRNVTHRAHTLLAYWSSLGGDARAPRRTFHGASMQDFLQLLRTARQEIDAQLARLIHDLERGVPLLNASGLPQTTETLCRVLDLLGPYMEHYPALSAQEVWERWRDNTLDQHYPLDKGTR